MMKKRNLLLIPIILIPYVFLLTILTIFFGTEKIFFKFILEKIFQGNVQYLLGTFLICCIITFILSALYFIFSIVKKWDPLSQSKIIMIIKIVHIPAYILIFILGLILMITIFTFPFIILLFIFDCWLMLLTSLLLIASILNSIRNKTFKVKELIWLIILQFIFCDDVISSIIFYFKLKKNYIVKEEIN